jgi:pilus assembly protein CpaB
MNRNRMLTGIGFAVLVGLLLSTFVYRQFKQLAASALSAPAQTQRIVVAAEAMAPGTRLDPSKLRMISWPGNQPMAGMCTRIQDCTNHALLIPVAENEPILSSKLAPTAAGAGLAATIPEGMRAMSVAVNDVVGVAGFVTPGTMVDVLVTGAISASGAPGQGAQGNITRTILENVRVLAAGQKVQQDNEGKPQTVPVITLLVTPDDAGKLAMASTEGKIQLALRNTVDADSSVPEPVLQSSLFASSGPVTVSKHTGAAKPAVPAPYTVEVISGDKRETKSFENQ